MGEAYEAARRIASIPVYRVVGTANDELVYVSTAAGSMDLWSLDLSSGARRRIAARVADVARPDGSRVAFTVDVESGRERHVVYLFDFGTGEFTPINMSPLRVMGMAVSGGRAAFVGAGDDIALYVWDGAATHRVHVFRDLAYVVDMEGDLVAGTIFHGNYSELFFYDLREGRLSTFRAGDATSDVGSRLRGGRALFSSSEDTATLRVLDLATGAHVEVLSGDASYPMFGWHGEAPWAVGKTNGRSRLYVDGRAVDTPPGTISGVAFRGNEAYISHSSLTSPHRILALDLGGGGVRTVIGNEDLELGDVQFIRVSSPDGVEVPTFLVRSSRAPVPGPTVVYVHGGPWSEVQDTWTVLIAALAYLGIHVVAPNFRGSTGYGERFRKLNIGDVGGGDLMDVVTAAKEVAPKVASALFIMGYSYGGYMTLMAAGRHPDMWRCAVAGAAVVDWEEMYELGDAAFKKFVEALLGGDRYLYRERSPITYVEGVKAPLCLIHPQNDTRTPLRPVLRYVERLLELGKRFELHVYPDMGHAFYSAEDVARLMAPGLDFVLRCAYGEEGRARGPPQ